VHDGQPQAFQFWQSNTLAGLQSVRNGTCVQIGVPLRRIRLVRWQNSSQF
jgi:hypothetical protein